MFFRLIPLVWNHTGMLLWRNVTLPIFGILSHISCSEIRSSERPTSRNEHPSFLFLKCGLPFLPAKKSVYAFWASRLACCKATEDTSFKNGNNHKGISLSCIWTLCKSCSSLLWSDYDLWCYQRRTVPLLRHTCCTRNVCIHQSLGSFEVGLVLGTIWF